MITTATDSSQSTKLSQNARWWLWLETILILVVICLQAATPVPAANEAHYLTKAKRFWQENWAISDYFLGSADAHFAFYALFGWLTQLFSLATSAWIVRMIGWTFLAYCWMRMSRSVVQVPLLSVLSSALFMATQRRFSMSLEWVVYGAEAKVFAYGFLFLAIASLMNRRWGWAWIYFGLAILWHPVVGGWGLVVGVGFAWIDSRGLTPFRQHWQALALGLLIAAGGVLPAALLNVGIDREIVHEAAKTHVYERLPHHLYPPGFLDGKVVGHLPLLGAWLFLGLLSCMNRDGRRFQLYVLGSGLITVLGLLIYQFNVDHSTLQASLLRFYWYRLFDVMVAIGMGMGVIVIANFSPTRFWRGVWSTPFVILMFVHFVDRWEDITRPAPIQFKLGGKSREELRASFADWLEMCQWIRENTPPDALFLTPTKTQTFLWYAHRGEVASWKNVPQDAKAIVEWRNRMLKLHGTMRSWELGKNLKRLSAEELRQLAKEFEIDYLVYYAEHSFDLPVVHRNEHFVLYAF